MSLVQSLRWYFFLAASMGLASCAALPPTLGQDQTKSLFDGRSLEGWHGDRTLWRVEDGAITGETKPDAPIRSNSFLAWQGGELQDFELRLKFRIFSGNSGVQFRSHKIGEFGVGGYQADIDADGHWLGILYDEDGRGILCRRGENVVISADGKRQVTAIDGFDPQVFAERTKSGEWHEYVIRAEGNRVTQTINGITTIALDDRETGKLHARGIIALQLHTGPAMKVQFKDIELTLLNGN